MSFIERFEFTPVYTTPEAAVDIILLHGLHGCPSKTWRANPNNNEGTTGGTFWPSDLLPASLAGAPANIIMYGYNADIISTSSNPGGPSQSYIFNHAQNLVAFLTLYRKRFGSGSGGDDEPFQGGKHRPILWVAHSLGGTLLKAALNYSCGITDLNLEDQRGVYVSTYGIIFLGTPHTGSDLAEWGLLIQRIVDAVFPWKLINTERALLKTLKKESETLININHQFQQIQHRFKIHLAYETQKTDLKGIKAMVVNPPGAANPLPGAICYGIEATHSGMCRFDRPTAPGYVAVSTGLRGWVLNAPAFIRRRWEAEREERRQYLSHQAADILWESQSIHQTDYQEGLVLPESPFSPSVHVESCRSSSVGECYSRTPSIDESCASPFTTSWNTSSPTLVAPPSPSSSPRRYLAGMVGKLTNRLRRKSDAGCQPSTLKREWTRVEPSDPRLSEHTVGARTEHTALLRPPSAVLAGNNVSRSCASSPGLQKDPFHPPPRPACMHQAHLCPVSAPVHPNQLSAPRVSFENEESDQ